MAWSDFKIGIRKCSWCGKFMGFKKGITGVTHGMCDECYKKERGKRKR